MKSIASGLTLLILVSTVSQSAFAQATRRPEEIAKAAFQRKDTNGDGRLSRREFRLDHLFDEVDKNKDGSVTLKEDIEYRLARMKRGFQQRRQVPPPEGANVHRDLVYAKVGERELPLDLYLPKSDQPLPVVIWVHGGGWRGGSKGNAGPARALIQQGYAVVDVEYRLSGEAIFPAQIQDCKAAVRWIRANAKKYNLDADSIGVWGSSAGGHLVALLGTSGDVGQFETDTNAGFSSRVQAVCDWFGPTDLLRMNQQAIPGSTLDHDAADSPESQLVGGPIQVEPYKSLAAKANPIAYVTPDDPPFLIVHGDKDKLVSYRQSVLLQEALTKAGIDSTLQIQPGAGHGFGGKTPGLVKQAAEFFDRHLKNKPKSSVGSTDEVANDQPSVAE